MQGILKLNSRNGYRKNIKTIKGKRSKLDENKEKKLSKKVIFKLNRNKIKYFKKDNILMPNYKKKPILEDNIINNIIKKIIKYNRNIVFLKKREFDIWYDTKLKYPLLVAEPIDEHTFIQNDNVRRDVVGDSFRPDPELNFKDSFTENDYKIYMEYGGSMGHNAPAGYHKTDINVYKDTFLLSNVCPQEITFNAGVWVLLETWCKDFVLNNHSRLNNVMIFTGSIKGNTKNFTSNMNNGTIEMNIPTHMYKIILYRELNRELNSDTDNNTVSNLDIKCIAVLYENKPQYVPNYHKYYDINNHVISLNKLSKLSHLNIENLLVYYKNKYNIYNDTIKLITKLDTGGIINRYKLRFPINPYFRNQLDRSKFQGKLIYSESLEELERNWKQVEKLKYRFKTIEFHREYYEMAKARLKNNES